MYSVQSKSTKADNKILLDPTLQQNAYIASNGSYILGTKSFNRIASEPSASSILFGSQYINLKVQRGSHDEWLKDARIFIQISALSGTGGTYIRLVNAPAVFMFDKFVLVCDQKEKETITADQLFEQLYKNVSSDQWQRIALDIGYNTSTTARNTAASAAQSFALGLKWMFNFFAKPVDLNTFANIEIRCYPKANISYCIQTDKTSPTFTFTNFQLDMQYITPIPEIVKFSKDLVLSGKSPTIFDYAYLQKDIQLASGITSATLNMPELEGKNVVDIAIVVRVATNINTANTSDYTDSNVAIYSFNIKSGNKYLNNLDQDMIVATDYQNLILPRYQFLGIDQIINRTNPAVVISFADDYFTSNIGRDQKFSGYKDFTGISDAIITLNFASGLASASTATVLVRSAKVMINALGILTNL